MNENTKQMIVMTLCMCLIVIVFLGATYAFMIWQDIFLKAEKYEYYKEYLERLENCKTLPMIICYDYVW